MVASRAVPDDCAFSVCGSAGAGESARLPGGPIPKGVFVLEVTILSLTIL